MKSKSPSSSPAVDPHPWQPVGLSGGGGTETPAISPHDPNLMLINCDMSGAYRSVDGGQTWQLLHWRQLTGCPFCAPAFHPADPNVVFAAYSYAAQLRISRDRGATWQPFGSGLPGGLRQIAIHPDEPRCMLAGTADAVFCSHDGGLQWSPANGVAGQSLGFHFDRTSPTTRRTCFTATARQFFRSDDGGITWNPIGHGLAELPIAAFAGASQSGQCRLYIWLDAPGASGATAGCGAIYRSDDRGASWQPIATMPVLAGYEQGYHALLVTDTAPDTVYAVKPCYTRDDTVWRSDDAGTTWRPVAFTDKTDPRYNMPDNYITIYFLPRSLQGWSTCGAAIDPRNPDHLLFNHYCSIFLTTDGGRSWRAGEVRPAPGNPDRTAPITRHRWIGNGLVNTTTWNFYVDPFENQRRYIAYTDIGMARSTDAGATWSWERRLGPNTYEMAFDPAVPGRIWAALAVVHDIPNNNTVLAEHPYQGKGCVGYTEDFGVTWRGRNRGLPGYSEEEKYDWDEMSSLAAGVQSVVIDPRSPKESRTLYASIWEHGVYQSGDGGQSWTQKSAGLGAPGVNLRVCRARLHPDGTLFVVITGKMRERRLMAEGVGLYRSRDRGEHWEKITAGLDLRWLTDFEIDPRDSRTIYLAACDDPGRKLKESGLYKTTDGGNAWTRLARKSSTHFGATVSPRNPDWVYMTLAYNDAQTPPLWLSRDAGATWAPFADYPFCSAHRVAFDPQDPGIIYVTTYGASVWQGPSEP